MSLYSGAVRPGFEALPVEVAAVNAVPTYPPASLVVVVRPCAVLSLTTEIMAPGIPAPVASLTVPTTRPVSVCAQATTEKRQVRVMDVVSWMSLFLIIPPHLLRDDLLVKKDRWPFHSRALIAPTDN